jgi:ATP-dependent protease Clp ATPase subunit
MEELMMDVMFDIPSQEDVYECAIDKATVDGRRAPTLKRRQSEESVA